MHSDRKNGAAPTCKTTIDYSALPLPYPVIATAECALELSTPGLSTEMDPLVPEPERHVRLCQFIATDRELPANGHGVSGSKGDGGSGIRQVPGGCGDIGE